MRIQRTQEFLRLLLMNYFGITGCLISLGCRHITFYISPNPIKPLFEEAARVRSFHNHCWSCSCTGGMIRAWSVLLIWNAEEWRWSGIKLVSSPSSTPTVGYSARLSESSNLLLLNLVASSKPHIQPPSGTIWLPVRILIWFGYYCVDSVSKYWTWTSWKRVNSKVDRSCKDFVEFRFFTFSLPYDTLNLSRWFS